MHIHSLTYRSHDPLQPVDWRARRARSLLRRGCDISPGHDDPSTVECFQFLSSWRNCSSKAERRQVAIRYPDIITAQRLRYGDPWRRLLIEARLLAGQPIEGIAAATGTTADAIASFGALFFDVHDRLGAPDYIVSQTIRRAAPRVTPAGLSAYILGVAFFGGLTALKATLAALGAHGGLICQPADLTTSGGRLTEQIRLAAQLHLLPGRPPSDLSYLRAMPVLTAGEGLPESDYQTADVSRLAMATAPDFRIDPAKFSDTTAGAAAKDAQAA